jgi:hypothetical protein
MCDVSYILIGDSIQKIRQKIRLKEQYYAERTMLRDFNRA